MNPDRTANRSALIFTRVDADTYTRAPKSNRNDGEPQVIRDHISSAEAAGRSALVPEVPDAGKHHRHSQFVRRSDHVCIAHGPARLNHGRRARSSRFFHAIGKRKERIGRHHAALSATVPPSAALITAIFTESTRLICPGADAHRLPLARKHDRVRFHVLADFPSKQQRANFRRASARVPSPLSDPIASVRAGPAPAPALPRNAFHIEFLRSTLRRSAFPAAADFSSRANFSSAAAAISRRHDALHEQFRHFFRRRGIKSRD